MSALLKDWSSLRVSSPQHRSTPVLVLAHQTWHRTGSAQHLVIVGYDADQSAKEALRLVKQARPRPPWPFAVEPE